MSEAVIMAVIGSSALSAIIQGWVALRQSRAKRATDGQRTDAEAAAAFRDDLAAVLAAERAEVHAERRGHQECLNRVEALRGEMHQQRRDCDQHIAQLRADYEGQIARVRADVERLSALP